MIKLISTCLLCLAAVFSYGADTKKPAPPTDIVNVFAELPPGLPLSTARLANEMRDLMETAHEVSHTWTVKGKNIVIYCADNSIQFSFGDMKTPTPDQAFPLVARRAKILMDAMKTSNTPQISLDMGELGTVEVKNLNNTISFNFPVIDNNDN